MERLEDARLLTGGGRYLDDLRIPGTLHAAFVRSEVAHGRVQGIDVEAARAVTGVHGIFTAEDLGKVGARRMPQTAPSPALTAEIATPYPLARDEVTYVGEPIAIVVADSRRLAEDSVRMVLVNYEPLPANVSYKKALAEDAPRTHLDAPLNVAGDLRGGFGDVDAAFGSAHRTFSLTIDMHRGGGHSMECRGVLAEYHEAERGWTVHTSTQLPHTIRKHLASHLDVDETQVRVRAPDVGGGFGPKGIFYQEEIVLPEVARLLGRPVKWVEDRREHFLTSVQQRDQTWIADVAVSAEGDVLGVRLRGLNDCGAFLLYGLLLPMNSMLQFPGPYRWGALDIELTAVFTNLTPTSPVRGAGRPYANFVMERIMDAVARELGLDPADVRRQNMIDDDAYPYQSGMKNPAGLPITYDSGSSKACLKTALDRSDYAGFEMRRTEAARDGRQIGIGVASYTEDGGIPPFEGATVRVLPNGRVIVQSGAASQGQGHATVLAQVCADQLGVSPAEIDVRIGDTDAIPRGIGTLGSRIAVMAGSSVYEAAGKVRDKALAFAAAALDLPVEDLQLEDGAVRSSQKALSLMDIASALNGTPGLPIPPGFEPGLEATAYHTATSSVFSNGTAVVEVEVDRETGGVVLKHCTFAHDCGRMINPLLVEGQILGGAVHGIGNALFERMSFDAEGQPLSMNYGEYLLPTATEIPPFDIVHVETPSPANPLGAKGVGESGTIPLAAAVIAAVENALRDDGVVFSHHPITPEDIVFAIDGTDR